MNQHDLPPDHPRRADPERRAGVEIKATLIGAAVAIVVLLLVGALLTAAMGPLEPAMADEPQQTGYALEIRAWIGSVLAIIVGFVAGGFAAARVAALHEPVNGLAAAALAAVVVFVFTIVAAVAGVASGVPSRLDLMSWSTDVGAQVMETLLMGGIWLGTMLGAGWVGGALGSKSAGRRPDIA